MNTTHHTTHESPAIAHEMRPVLPSFGKLLERTWNFFTEHASLFALIGLPVFIASILSALPFMANNAVPDLLPTILALNGAVGLVMKLIYVALSLLWPLALVRAVISRRHGKDLSLPAAYEPGWEMLGQYAIVLILTALISCLALFIFLVPGIYLQVAFSIVLFVLVAEGKRAVSILTTSLYRVKGYWWPVFGRLLGLTVIVLVVLALVSAVLAPLVSLLLGFARVYVNMYHLGNLFGQAVQVFLVMPLFYVFLSELYHSLHSINGKDLSISEHRSATNVLISLSAVGLLAAVFWAYFLTAVLSPALSYDRGYRRGMMGGYKYQSGMMVRPY